MVKKISVIIPTFNKVERLKIIIDGLERQTLDKSLYEIIFVNDGSIDGTKEFLDTYEWKFNVHVIHQVNKGQATARNVGLAVASGEIILFMDDDLMTPSNFLEEHVKAHKMYKDTVVLGKIFLIKSEFFCYISSQYKEYGYEETLKRLPKFVEKDLYLDMIQTIYVKKLFGIEWICFTGGNSSVSRNVLEKIGGFDEQFFRWGPEDIELGYRFLKLNLSFQFVPEIFNYHLDIVKDRNQMLKDTAKNLKYLKHKYPNNLSIENYVNYTSGGLSLQEFYCRENNITFSSSNYDDLFYFRPFDYINMKSKVMSHV